MTLKECMLQSARQLDIPQELLDMAAERPELPQQNLNTEIPKLYEKAVIEFLRADLATHMARSLGVHSLITDKAE